MKKHKLLVMALCIVMMLGTWTATAQAAPADEMAVQEEKTGSVAYAPSLDTEEITEVRYAGAEGSSLRQSSDVTAAVIGYLEPDTVLYLFKVVRSQDGDLWAETRIDETDSIYYIPFEETKMESAVGSGYVLPEPDMDEAEVPSASHNTPEESNDREGKSALPAGEHNAGSHGGMFTITTYCPCAACNGKWAGMPTASGTTITPGRTIAVDPSVIPLGTSVYIDGIGTRIAEDTGGAIKGNRIDLAVANHNESGTWTAQVTW